MASDNLGANAMSASDAVQVERVNADNFERAETDTYFASFAKEGGLGRLMHYREMADIARQTVVRSNRDTLYSSGLFDLDAGAVSFTLPDAAGRFMSLLLVNEDHYIPVPTTYAPGTVTLGRERAETRYVLAIVRTFADPNDAQDMARAHALQDAIQVEQKARGLFEAPSWDPDSLARTRSALKALEVASTAGMFGPRERVDPVRHLIGTATGWGGNPAEDAVYEIGQPERNDGETVHRLRVRDVPVDAFWSVSVYNADGFFEPNPQNAYSLNSVTARRDADGAYTIQFGGCDGAQANCLPITPGWNYTVRLYRPRAEILNGTWSFPKAQPVA